MSKTVKATFSRWVDDRLEELDMDRATLAIKMDTNLIWVSRIIGEPENATIEQVQRLATALSIKDWYGDLVEAWNMGVKRCTLFEYNQLLVEQGQGDKVGRIQHAA